MTKKSAVVTGGAGFIGSHLAEKLVERGYRVVILDDLSTGKMENIEGLVDTGKAEFIAAIAALLACCAAAGGQSLEDVDLSLRLPAALSRFASYADVAGGGEAVDKPSVLRDLLQRHNGNISRAARQAGIERAYLQRLVRKHDLKP